jgi:shikimate dehydrogenase
MLIINTTPIGMYPNVNEVINIPYHAMGEKHLIIDLIYNPSETLFIKNAKKNNAHTLNGYTMLVNQALKSWDIWNQ